MARILRKFKNPVMTAKAVNYGEEEVKEVIDGKQREILNTQKELKMLKLNLDLKVAELNEMKSQIDNSQIKVLWSGMTCPVEIAKANYNITVEVYKEMQGRINYLIDALKNFGFTKEQIEGIFTGKMLKLSDVKEIEKN
jgi:hypothetical protein